ncbi:hypothetical protein HanHA300_Chr13g0470221 [Helianthus annuus]|nr:hypothetical protein HanHA300_Chr13g0470221 [Helianthus annuus]KAJ0662679.1 hypothetical protein HanLR1_Chr13g0472431 [Helianthus annuus]
MTHQRTTNLDKGAGITSTDKLTLQELQVLTTLNYKFGQMMKDITSDDFFTKNADSYNISLSAFVIITSIILQASP